MVDLISETKGFLERQRLLQEQIHENEENYSRVITENKESFDQGVIDFVYWNTDIKTNYFNQILDKPIRYFVSKNREVSYTCKTCGKQIKFVKTSRDCNVPDECDACKRDREKIQKQQYAQGRAEGRAELERLKRMPYKEYLQTEHWQTFRKRALKHFDYRCQLCGQGNKTLEVHHRSYENRGEETYKDIIVLCHDCHSKYHGKDISI